MSALRNLVDKIKPTFTKGGKLGFLESTFDAFETFLFVPNTTTQKGAHIRDCNDMKRTMIMVVVSSPPAVWYSRTSAYRPTPLSNPCWPCERPRFPVGSGGKNQAARSQTPPPHAAH